MTDKEVVEYLNRYRYELRDDLIYRSLFKSNSVDQKRIEGLILVIDRVIEWGEEIIHEMEKYK